MLGTTSTYKSINAVNVHRDVVQLACYTGTHVHYLTVECDTTRTLSNTLGMMFVFPITVDIDHDGNVTVNNHYFGKFKKLSLKSK